MSKDAKTKLTTKEVHAAGRFNQSFTPYFDQTYFPPKQVLDLYPEPDVSFPTPAFIEGQKAFTSQEQMMEFLENLAKDIDFMRLEIIGQTFEGRDIPMLVFTKSESEDSADFKQKPTVWLQAQIHGNEPAAGESALVIAYKLAKEELGTELLNDLNIIIIPRMNPDSAYYFERYSTRLLDGNRDHMNLHMPELQAIHATFNRYLPEVVIDAHEYGATPTYHDVGEEGALKYHDVLLQSGKNLNIPKSIRDLSDEILIDSAFKALEKEGFSYDRYYTSETPENEKPIIKEGGVDPGTGRNTFGLKPSLCILVETMGIGVGREMFLRRVAGQVVTHTAMLRATKQHAAEIKQAVKQARMKIAEGGRKGDANDKIILASELKEVPNQTIKAVDIAKGEVIDIPVKYYSASDAYATLERVRPNAYILPPAYHHLAEKLIIQGAHVQKLAEAQELTVECYHVTDVATKVDKDQIFRHVTTELVEKTIFFPKGSYVISSAQAVGNIVSLALEPESSASYVTNNFLPIMMGHEIPVYRLMKDFNFPLE